MSRVYRFIKLRSIALLFGLLIGAHPASAAITHLASIGTANSTVSGTSLAITTGTTLNVGEIAIGAIAIDNNCDSNNVVVETTEVSSVTDSASNTWSRLKEICTSQNSGGVNAGSTLSIWLSKITTQLTAGGTITFNHLTKTARAARVRSFSVGTGNTLEISGTPVTNSLDEADAPSATINTLADGEYLFLRLLARERASTTALTLTTNYTAWGIVTADNGGNDDISMSVRGEFRIFTVSGGGGSGGDTSNPTESGGTTSDAVDIYFALKEAAVPAATTVIAPIIIQ